MHTSVSAAALIGMMNFCVCVTLAPAADPPDNKPAPPTKAPATIFDFGLEPNAEPDKGR